MIYSEAALCNFYGLPQLSARSFQEEEEREGGD